VGRGNEGRNFFGFNYRMMELQGAIGLAQLRKLPDMIARQRTNKQRIKAMLAKVPGLTFRQTPDPDGDTATFLAFYLSTREKTEAFNRVLSENKAGAIHFMNNTWHHYAKWEQLHEKKTAFRSGWPFQYTGDRVLDYPADALPQTLGLLSRTLAWQINLNMSEADFDRIGSAIEKAAQAL
jgi:8-amino-3,8-dideoxy-alpha-D-manno-octulosonate transaminase